MRHKWRVHVEVYRDDIRTYEVLAEKALPTHGCPRSISFYGVDDVMVAHYTSVAYVVLVTGDDRSPEGVK